MNQKILISILDERIKNSRTEPNPDPMESAEYILFRL